MDVELGPEDLVRTGFRPDGAARYQSARSRVDGKGIRLCTHPRTHNVRFDRGIGVLPGTIERHEVGCGNLISSGRTQHQAALETGSRHADLPALSIFAQAIECGYAHIL